MPRISWDCGFRSLGAEFFLFSLLQRSVFSRLSLLLDYLVMGSIWMHYYSLSSLPGFLVTLVYYQTLIPWLPNFGWYRCIFIRSLSAFTIVAYMATSGQIEGKVHCKYHILSTTQVYKFQALRDDSDDMEEGSDPTSSDVVIPVCVVS